MPIRLSSPHVHTRWCDGQSTTEEMVLAALGLGFVSLGFSSHGVQGFDPEYCIAPEHEADYIAEVRRVQKQHADRLRVWLGIERDYFSTADRGLYDYVLASVHYLPNEGEYVPVDGALEDVQRYVREACEGDGAEMAVRYYQLLGAYVAEYKPDIIGHFDIVSKHNRDGSLFDPADARVRRAADDALELAFTGCRLMEVNTGAVKRSGGAPYPGLRVLKRWRDMGGEVILSSDCHHASQMDGGYEQGLQLMREAGYARMLLLGTKDTLFEECAI